MSRIDVIVPCYQYGHFLRECVDSVLAQDGVQVRVLVIDDASPDNTAEIASELAARDGRVLFRRHTVNHGHIATYNEGLAWADSTYLLVLDADDLLAPGALLRGTRLMDAHPEVGLIHGHAFVTRDPATEIFTVGSEHPWRVLSGSAWIHGVCSRGMNPVFQATALVRTSLQRAVGGYRPELPHAGDMEMWLRLAARGSVGIIDGEQACYRQHANNMSARYRGIPDLRQLRECFEMFFSECGHLLTDPQRLRQLALSRVARRALRQSLKSVRRGEINAARELLTFALPDGPFQLIPLTRDWLVHKLSRPARSGPDVVAHASQ